MKIKTRWFMIELKKYNRCTYIYPQDVIDKQNESLKKLGMEDNDRRCKAYKTNFKKCPFHGDVTQ